MKQREEHDGERERQEGGLGESDGEYEGNINDKFGDESENADEYDQDGKSE